MFGRSAPLASVRAAGQRAIEDGAQLVTIRGEAGIGKSSLLGAAAAELEDGGMRVVRVALSSVESQLGWAGLRLLCDGLAEPLRTLAEPARGVLAGACGRSADAAEVDPARVAFSLAELLDHAAPVAIFVDDLHWLDQPSASALAFAVRSTAARPVLTVLAHRPVELPIDPARLLDQSCRVSIELEGLSVASLHRVLREKAGVRLGRPDAARIHAATGGSPLHAMEIGRLLSNGVSLDDALVHPSAFDVIASRLRAVPEDARAVLLAAALAAAPTLQRIAGVLPDVDVEAALAGAPIAGLADVRRGVIQFVHPLVPAALVAGAGGATRRSLQRALAEHAADPDERVLLLQASTDGPDDALAAELDAAASRASDRGDVIAAARFARWAAERTPPDAVGARVGRLLDAADLALAGGDHQVPVELAEAAMALDDSVDVLFRANVTKALTIGNRGDEWDALALLDATLERLTGRPAQCARIHDIRCQVYMRNDVPAALEAARASLDAAAAAHDSDAVDRARSLVDLMSVMVGEPVDLHAVAERCERLPLTGVARDWCATVLNLCDLASVSRHHCTLQLAEYQRLGLVHYEAPVHSRLLLDLITLGRYRDALREAETCLDFHEMLGGLIEAPLHADIAFLTTVLGDESRAVGARRTAERVLATAVDTGDKATGMARMAQLAVLRGQWAKAADWAQQAEGVAQRTGLGRSGVVPHRIEGLEAMVHLGRIGEAEDLLATIGLVAERTGMPRGPADMLRARALLASARGDLDGAVELGVAAIDAYRSIDFPLDVARGEQFVGSALRRAGRRTEAAEYLRLARLAFEKLEATPLVARVDAETARLGARRSSGGTALTPTEQQVADLVVAGRSNAEIAAALVVSLRTVESNLTKAYRKLGVRSRTELVATLRRS